MTKCHTIFLFFLALSLASCHNGNQTTSLAEYSGNSQAGKFRSFEQYAVSLTSMTRDEAFAAQREKMKGASGDSASWRELLKLEEQFINDVNSPYRCEDYFIPVLEAVKESPFSTPEEKEDATFHIGRYSLNPLGSVVSDFTYTLRNGRSGNLHSVKGEYILLFFSNPGCENCKEVMDRMEEIPFCRNLVETGRLKVVNIYPDDDIQAWFDYVATYPDEWISGFAPEVDDWNGDEPALYNLRAIPTLYLLDSDYRLLLKDAPLDRILTYLNNPR